MVTDFLMKYRIRVLLSIVLGIILFGLVYYIYPSKKIHKKSPREKIIDYIVQLKHYETRNDFEKNINTLIFPNKAIFSGLIIERDYCEQSVQITNLPEISILITMKENISGNQSHEKYKDDGDLEIFAINVFDLGLNKKIDYDDKVILWWHDKIIKTRE